MALGGIQLRVVDQEIMATLDRIERLADRPAPIMSEISGFMVTAVQRHIETETGPDGRWQGLSRRTAARRIGSRRRGYANMLRVSNRLYSSITGESTDTTAAVGTNLDYAPPQFLGATINMPARDQDIHLGKTNRGKRFVRASAKRKETMRVKVGAHTVTIPARNALYLSDQDKAEIQRIVEDAFRAEAGGGQP